MNPISKPFDLVIPVGGKDCFLLRRNLKILKQNLKPEKIYVITKRNYFIYFINLGGHVELIDEDQLIDQVNFKKITTYLLNVGLDKKITGWYLQQFLKMGFALSVYATKKYYLSWDADTIPLKEIKFFDGGGKPYFTMKDEYHTPYFDTIKKIFNLEKKVKESFISENMIFDVEMMKEIISKIQNSDLNGENWCEKIINSVLTNDKNGFSEFETYGTYVLNHYPQKYTLRTLNSFRECGKQYSRILISKHFKKLSQKYIIISLENKNRPKTLEGVLDWLEKGSVFIINKILNYSSYFSNLK